LKAEQQVIEQKIKSSEIDAKLTQKGEEKAAKEAAIACEKEEEKAKKTTALESEKEDEKEAK
jgi:hypothetical protein